MVRPRFVLHGSCLLLIIDVDDEVLLLLFLLVRLMSATAATVVRTMMMMTIMMMMTMMVMTTMMMMMMVVTMLECASCGPMCPFPESTVEDIGQIVTNEPSLATLHQTVVETTHRGPTHTSPTAAWVPKAVAPPT